MTPVDEQVRAAVRRVDLGWLTAHLGAEDRTPAVVRLLVRQDDPRLRHLGLTWLGARIARPRIEESELVELASLLPGPLDGPGTPETALLLAHLHQQLWQYVPPRRRPRWRTADLPVRVRIAWLRAEILHQPKTVRLEPAGELLYQAVNGIAATDGHQLDELVSELIVRGDQALHGVALRLAGEGLRSALLAPARVRAHLDRLLDAPSTDIAVAALRALTEPWAALVPIRREKLRRFRTAGVPGPGPTVVDAVVAAATRHGHGDLLRDVIVDEAVPPRSRQGALRALGELVGREDIHVLMAIAAADPLLLGGAAVACLRAMHRRGQFPAGDDAAAIVALALADHTIRAAEVATIMFTCRHEAFRALVATEADDVTWPRRLELLVGLARQGGGDLPVGDAVVRVLPAASRPEPFLAAIRALRHLPAEAAVLDALPRSPASALHTLEAIGGPRTVVVLAEALGLNQPDGDGVTGVIVSYLRPVRHHALEVLWHLADDPDRRRAILTRLHPRDVPRRIAVDLGAADQRELALLAANVDPDNPVEALLGLARNGDAHALAPIADLLLRIVADLAASWVAGGHAEAVDTGNPDGRSTGEPTVPDEVVTAIDTLGRRLHDRGKLRPYCLREAADAHEAGCALVATMVLDLLDRPGLAGGEQAILLALLRRVPHADTRARVHPLLRHRDRHVRKHVIALLAADATGDDAEALSASLIALTTAPDGQTVRQALLALGHIRACWAAPAIAGCLDHPTMNIKKTAAEVLVRAGTPAVVPKLLFWLGHHDNPGLRAALIEALRAVLGTAYAATVLAAAEQTSDERSRRLLLDGLGGVLSARAVNSLAGQRSTVAPMLLALVAAGSVGLAEGTVEDLAGQLAAYGVSAPVSRTSTTTGPSDSDVEALVRDGWTTGTALRIVGRQQRQPDQLSVDQLARLRPMLADWLHLADNEPAARVAVLRLILRFCPAPWSAGEVETFTRAAQVLVTGLTGAAGSDRDELIAVLEAVVPDLHAAEALDVVGQVRALAPTSAGQRSLLALLRRCGAVLTRADVEQSLAAARLGPDPWTAEIVVLRDAFAVPATPASEEGSAWRLALEAAVSTPDALRDFRSHRDHPPSSRERLHVLIGIFPSLGPDVRVAALDWMEALQPIDAPPWTLTENAHRPGRVPRTPNDGDLDQPRSAAQRQRLLALLDAPTARRRTSAAAALRDWPEPETAREVLRAFLAGRAEVAITVDLARALTTLDETELRNGPRGSGDADAVHERVARVASYLDPSDLYRLLPLLLEWWEHGGSATRASVERTLRRADHADVLAESLQDRLAAGEWGHLDLITGLPLLRTAALADICRRLRAEGRADLAGRLILVDGPLRQPDAARVDASRLAALRERPQPPAPSAPRGPSRHELFHLIRTGRHTARIRRALTLLAESCEDSRPAGGWAAVDEDPELENLLAELLHHPEPRVRLHAHRVGRRLLDRPTHLRHTVALLGDPEPDVVRSAIRILSHAAHPPAIAAIVGLLAHSHAVVRRTAAAGLVQIGSSAIPALRYAASHARPDRRRLYTTLLDQITAGATSETRPGAGPGRVHIRTRQMPSPDQP